MTIIYVCDCGRKVVSKAGFQCLECTEKEIAKKKQSEKDKT